MLQKQREDLDRVTEENKVLKSRYENAIKVNVHYIEYFISNIPYFSYLSIYICMYTVITLILNLVQAV